MTFTALQIQYNTGGAIATVTFRSDEAVLVRVVKGQKCSIKYLTNGSPRITYFGDAKTKVIAQMRKKDATHAAILALLAIESIMRIKVYDGSGNVEHDLYMKIDPNAELPLFGAVKTWEPVALTFIETTSGEVSVARFGSS